MSAEPLPRKSPLWMMGWMVLMAWVAVGVYRRQVPPLTTAKAVLKVPSATDLESLCRRPELAQTAVELLEAEDDVLVILEEGIGQLKLSGHLTATKILSAPTRLESDSNAGPDRASTETWELTYRTPLRDRAQTELAALISALEQRLLPKPTIQLQDTPDTTMQDRRLAIQVELDALSAEQSAASIDPSQLVGLQERIRTLQRTLTEAQNDRLKAEEEWRLVEEDFLAKPHLGAIAAKLSAGPIQDAVLQVEQQRKQSAELNRLNEIETRWGSLYGEKHPKLVELRQRFEQLLSDLGGWDQVLDEGHVGDHLRTSLRQVLELKQQLADDLQTQLDLEQSDLSNWHQTQERQAKLQTELSRLNDDPANDERTTSSAFAIQQPPELSPPDWHADLPTLMASVTVAGMILGWLLHRIGSPAPYHVIEYRTELEPQRPVSLPPPTSSPEANLTLAQRRALRQARLQQAYAS